MQAAGSSQGTGLKMGPGAPQPAFSPHIPRDHSASLCPGVEINNINGCPHSRGGKNVKNVNVSQSNISLLVVTNTIASCPIFFSPHILMARRPQRWVSDFFWVHYFRISLGLWTFVLLATKTCPNPARGNGCCRNMGCILQTWIEIGALYFKYGSWGPSCGQAWPWVCALGCLWKLFCDHPLGPDTQERFEMPLLAFCCVLIDSGDVGQGVNGRR